MSDFDYLEEHESKKLINFFAEQKNNKYILISYLLLDLGLRVSECVTLQIKNFDFKNRNLKVKTLKRKNDEHRTIPISDRCFNSLANYLEEHTKITKDKENYIFPNINPSKLPHLSRKSVWMRFNKIKHYINVPNLHPHALRHTFATQHLASQTNLVEIKNMLGHSSYDTTLIYAKTPISSLKKSVQNRENRAKTLIQKIFKPKNKAININYNNDFFTIGRQNELNTINKAINNNINVVLFGSIGVGKSHLLKCIKTKSLHLDDLSNFKKSLLSILLYLYNNDKNAVLNLIYKDFTIPELTKKISRESTINLSEMIIKSTEPNEYTLIIDNIDNLTPSVSRVLEKFRNHMPIICACRELRVNVSSFLWDFDQIKIKPLNKSFTYTLINKISSNLEYKDKEILFSHVFNQTNGNPRAIHELINRLSKEPFLSDDIIKNTTHIGAIKQLDMSFLLVVSLGLLTALRYASREFDEPAFRLIGSIGLILLIVSRPFLTSIKKSTKIK